MNSATTMQAPDTRNHANSPEGQDGLQRRHILHRDEPTRRQPRRSKIRIHIPSNTWSLERIRKGTKRATTRTRRYGSPGDKFTALGRTFIILAITKMRLGEVAVYHYKDEGAATKEEFIEVWKSLHPPQKIRPRTARPLPRIRTSEIALSFSALLYHHLIMLFP